MILKKQPIDNIPKDAVILSYQEAVDHQLTAIREWKDTSETWPLRWGIAILSFGACTAGAYINGHYRRKLKLRNIGVVTTYLPIVVLPGIVAGIIHKLFVTNDIIMEKVQCPVCIQTRAALFQTAIGGIYPMVLGPLGNFMYATRHATYRLPNILEDPFGSVRLLVKFARPIGTQLSVIFIGQGILGSVFTYMEAKSYYKLKQKMLEVEKEYEDSRMNSIYE